MYSYIPAFFAIALSLCCEFWELAAKRSTPWSHKIYVTLSKIRSKNTLFILMLLWILKLPSLLLIILFCPVINSGTLGNGMIFIIIVAGYCVLDTVSLCAIKVFKHRNGRQ